MESNFTALLAELNRTEKEYQIKNRQYTELRGILLQEAPSNSEAKSTSNKDNVAKKIGCASSLESGKMPGADGEAAGLKKLVKNRIREYHSLKSNAEKFKGSDKEKNKFMLALEQSNRDILGGLHVDTIQTIIDAIEQQ